MLRVGPGQTYAVPSAAAAVVQNGDVVKISAGDYRGDVARWTVSNLTICGVGGRARLYANGNSSGGKAIWVIAGSNVTVDSIDFHDAAVPDKNGAGIRAEHSGFLLIRNSGFYDNEDGILGGGPGATVTIEGSEFARNGYGDGYSHGVYINNADRLTVRNSFFHETRIGHHLKSRAAETRVENSYFMDGPAGTSSYLADFPSGGAVTLRGNLFQKGPKADNPNAIAFGAENLSTWATNTLEMVHNTVVITRSGGSFVSAPAGTQSVRLRANLFAGTNSPVLLAGSFPSGNIVQSDNVTSVASNIPGADVIAAPNFWPNAALASLIRLNGVPDASYTVDSPAPFTLRSIAGSARVAGALQAAP